MKRAVSIFVLFFAVSFQQDASAQDKVDVRVYVERPNTESLTEEQRSALQEAVGKAVVGQFQAAGWNATVVNEQAAGPGSFNITIGKSDPIVLGSNLLGEGTAPSGFCECAHTDLDAMTKTARGVVDDAIKAYAAEVQPSSLTIECQPGDVQLSAEGAGQLRCGKQSIAPGRYTVVANGFGFHEGRYIVTISVGENETLFVKLRAIERSNTYRYLSFGMMGAGGAAIGVGVFNLFIHKKETDGILREERPRNSRTRGVISASVGAGLLLGGAALYWFKAREPQRSEVLTPVPVKGGVGLLWTGSF